MISIIPYNLVELQYETLKIIHPKDARKQRTDMLVDRLVEHVPQEMRRKKKFNTKWFLAKENRPC